eukprot:4536935-Lingulodinium_polyedra.AAC.1
MPRSRCLPRCLSRCGGGRIQLVQMRAARQPILQEVVRAKCWVQAEGPFIGAVLIVQLIGWEVLGFSSGRTPRARSTSPRKRPPRTAVQDQEGWPLSRPVHLGQG